MKKKQRAEKLIYKLSIPILIIFAFILYANTISNGYSLDDTYINQANPNVAKGISGIPAIFQQHYVQIGGELGKDVNFGYRPIPLSTFALEYSLFGPNPYVSHLINILYYVLCLILLWRVFYRLFGSIRAYLPLLATLLFAAHPLHTEVVASLKNRDELLVFLFGIWALNVFISYMNRNKTTHLILGALLLLLGYFCKPTILVFIPIIPLSLYFFVEKNNKKLIRIFSVSVVAVIIGAFLPLSYLPEANRLILYTENPLIFENNLLVRIPAAFIILFHYVKLLFYPHPLLFYYGFDMVSYHGTANIMIAIVSAVIHIFIFIWAIINAKKKPFWSYGIIFYLLSIVIYSNLISPPPGIIAERFAFTAIAGFSILLVLGISYVAKLIAQQKNRNVITTILFLFVLIIYTVLSIQRNQDWKDELTLFSHDMPYLEKSAQANFMYAAMLKDMDDKVAGRGNHSKIQKNRKQLTMEHLNRALAVYPDYYQAINMKALLELEMNQDFEASEGLLKKAIELEPDYESANYNLAILYHKTNNENKAIEYYKNTIRIDPTNRKANLYLAIIYDKQGFPQKALETLKNYQTNTPGSKVPPFELGLYFLHTKDTVAAVPFLEKAAGYKKFNEESSMALYHYYMNKNKPKRAEFHKRNAEEYILMHKPAIKKSERNKK